MDYVDLGRRVRKQRILLGWTQERLAREIGVSTSFVGHIERGSRKASLETLVLLSNAMQISTDSLLGGSLKKRKGDAVEPVETLSRSQRYALKQMLSTMQEQMYIWDQEDPEE